MSNRPISHPLASPFVAAATTAWLLYASISPSIATASESDLPEQEATSILLDSKADVGVRRDAVQRLITYRTQTSIDLLNSRIKSRTDLPLQQLIVQAMVQRDATPPDEFRDSLLGLLDQADSPLLEDVAALLGRYDDPVLTARMVSLAADPGTPARRRIGAILVLGHHRTQAVAAVLMGLIESSNPRGIRAAALESLEELSGIIDFNDDVVLWKLWWQEQSSMSELEWTKQVAADQARRGQQFASQKAGLQDRLVELERQIYFAADESARPGLLKDMLSDQLDAVRLSAVRIMVKRLIDGQPIVPKLVAALIVRLDDTSPTVRRETALLLRDLKDAAGADAVAERLADDKRENYPEVLKAYLLVMARAPRAAAVDRAMLLIEDPTFRDQGAAALSAACDAGLVSPAQRKLLADEIRSIVRIEETPNPAAIELLGRLATEEDWALVATFLRNDDPTVKAAAAGAWSRAGRPLAPLAERADDPLILPILIDASAKRGDDLATAQTLIAHKPAQEQLVLLWQRAIIAVARRLPRDQVAVVDDSLAQDDFNAPLRDLVLTEILADAIPPDPVTAPATAPAKFPTAVTALLLRRAQLRLQRGDPALGLADFRHLLADPRFALEGQTKSLVLVGASTACLTTGDSDAAYGYAYEFLKQPATDPAARQRIVQLFIDSADRSLRAGQRDQAARTLKPLRNLAGASLTATQANKLAQLEQDIQPPTTASTTAPG